MFKIVYEKCKQESNCFRVLLSGDIKTNPGAIVVNPTKTRDWIAAQYSQSNAEVFGIRIPGRQCVAMSLSALIWLMNE